MLTVEFAFLARGTVHTYSVSSPHAYGWSQAFFTNTLRYFAPAGETMREMISARTITDA